MLSQMASLHHELCQCKYDTLDAMGAGVFRDITKQNLFFNGIQNLHSKYPTIVWRVSVVRSHDYGSVCSIRIEPGTVDADVLAEMKRAAPECIYLQLVIKTVTLAERKRFGELIGASGMTHYCAIHAMRDAENVLPACGHVTNVLVIHCECNRRPVALCTDADCWPYMSLQKRGGDARALRKIGDDDVALPLLYPMQHMDVRVRSVPGSTLFEMFE